MTVTLRPVDPQADAAVLTRWVTAPGAEFWGMADLTEAQVAEIYGHIVEEPHLTADVLLLDDVPLGLVQTYDPEVDEIGQWYDRHPGDLGVHLLLADDPARRGRTAELLDVALTSLFARPGCRRLVLEPDARNERSIALMERLGAERGPLVELRTSISEKPAQFFFLDPRAPGVTRPTHNSRSTP